VFLLVFCATRTLSVRSAFFFRPCGAKRQFSPAVAGGWHLGFITTTSTRQPKATQCTPVVRVSRHLDPLEVATGAVHDRAPGPNTHHPPQSFFGRRCTLPALRSFRLRQHGIPNVILEAAVKRSIKRHIKGAVWVKIEKNREPWGACYPIALC
jgi:hypothetical protein